MEPFPQEEEARPDAREDEDCADYVRYQEAGDDGRDVGGVGGLDDVRLMDWI